MFTFSFAEYSDVYDFDFWFSLYIFFSLSLYFSLPLSFLSLSLFFSAGGCGWVQADPFGSSDPFASAFPTTSSASHNSGFDAFGTSWPASNSSYEVRGLDGGRRGIQRERGSFVLGQKLFFNH
jgi:hypothetical protein